MKSYKLRKMLLIGSLSATVSCGHVTVKDKEACADLGSAGAHCAHTYITKRRDIPKQEWDHTRIGWICMSSDDFIDGEDSLDEVCRISDLCDYETKDQLAKFKARMKPLLKKAKVARELNDQTN